MLFKRVGDTRPYPDHGLSSRDWAAIRPTRVRLSALTTTKRTLDLEIVMADDSTFYGDRPHEPHPPFLALRLGCCGRGSTRGSLSGIRGPCPPRVGMSATRNLCPLRREPPPIGTGFSCGDRVGGLFDDLSLDGNGPNLVPGVDALGAIW